MSCHALARPWLLLPVLLGAGTGWGWCCVGGGAWFPPLRLALPKLRLPLGDGVCSSVPYPPPPAGTWPGREPMPWVHSGEAVQFGVNPPGYDLALQAPCPAAGTRGGFCQASRAACAGVAMSCARRQEGPEVCSSEEPQLGRGSPSVRPVCRNKQDALWIHKEAFGCLLKTILL